MTDIDVAAGAVAEWWNDNQWHYVSSSNVEAFRYDPARRTLDIQYGKGSRQYRYLNIPPEMAAGLANAPSAGGWVWANVRGAPFERL